MRSWDGIEVQKPSMQVVKWELCEPRIIIQEDGQLKIVSERCYPIAYVIWNPVNEEYELKSMGMKFLEAHPSVEAMDMICAQAKEDGRNGSDY